MAAGGMSLEQQFQNFAKFQDATSDGSRITLMNVDFWLRQAKLLDGRKITMTDTGIAFNKFRKRTIDFERFLLFLDDLSVTKGIAIGDMKSVLTECGLPGADKEKENQPKAKLRTY